MGRGHVRRRLLGEVVLVAHASTHTAGEVLLLVQERALRARPLVVDDDGGGLGLGRRRGLLLHDDLLDDGLALGGRGRAAELVAVAGEGRDVGAARARLRPAGEARAPRHPGRAPLDGALAASEHDRAGGHGLDVMGGGRDVVVQAARAERELAVELRDGAAGHGACAAKIRIRRATMRATRRGRRPSAGAASRGHSGGIVASFAPPATAAPPPAAKQTALSSGSLQSP
mmetsp:Transcript_8529/g.24223  ORF Transcript_8529/g.24223 Transcript_8529/m.24223 type:complete len:229 (+) Transcript_8529:50-736(+)